MSKFYITAEIGLKVRWMSLPTSQVEKNRRAFMQSQLDSFASKLCTAAEMFLSHVVTEAEKE